MLANSSFSIELLGWQKKKKKLEKKEKKEKKGRKGKKKRKKLTRLLLCYGSRRVNGRCHLASPLLFARKFNVTVGKTIPT